jgi:DNA-binding CsgD family transcriptional regulator
MSDLYNLVYRRFDQHHALYAPVMVDGKPVGMLGLHRSRQQKPFDAYEQVLLARLLPYVAHALRGGGNGTQYSDNGSLGMIVMDTQGTILYLTNEATSLLAMVCHPVFSPDARSQEGEILSKLAQLCRNLQGIFQGKHAAPPSWCHTNGRGRFTFRASWLNRLNNEQDKLISMTIEHHEPLVLKILRALQDLPLSPVQKQVALLLAQGVFNELIGGCLNIKLSTTKEHISKIFAKLNIYRREELLPLLLALEKQSHYQTTRLVR